MKMGVQLKMFIENIDGQQNPPTEKTIKLIHRSNWVEDRR